MAGANEGNTVSRYDPKDYAANPGKYRLFRTARVATNMFTHDGVNDLRVGEHVAIEYRLSALNKLYRREEPVYTIVGKDCDLYANALCDFCL